jgi:hypothetical protein
MSDSESPSSNVKLKCSGINTVLSRFLRQKIALQIPAYCGQSFRRIADSIPVIADSF